MLFFCRSSYNFESSDRGVLSCGGLIVEFSDPIDLSLLSESSVAVESWSRRLVGAEMVGGGGSPKPRL